jgi:hypothetical protein
MSATMAYNCTLAHIEGGERGGQWNGGLDNELSPQAVQLLCGSMEGVAVEENSVIRYRRLAVALRVVRAGGEVARSLGRDLGLGNYHHFYSYHHSNPNPNPNPNLNQFYSYRHSNPNTNPNPNPNPRGCAGVYSSLLRERKTGGSGIKESLLEPLKILKQNFDIFLYNNITRQPKFHVPNFSIFDIYLHCNFLSYKFFSVFSVFSLFLHSLCIFYIYKTL